MKGIPRPVLYAACAALMTAGCVNVPPPASLTESWRPPAAASAEDTVWRDIRAGTPAPEQPLSLLTLADMALENNPATRKAWNEARTASEQVRYTQGFFLPSVTAVAGLTRTSVSAHPETLDENKMNYGPGLQLSYLVCNFGGGRHAAVEQALHSVYAANFAFNRAIQDTLLSVETAYYAVISAGAGAEAAETNALDTKAILDAAAARRDAGLGIDLDVLQAQAGYDQALYTLAAAEGQKQTAKGLLAQALHLPADTPLQVAPPAEDIPASLSETDMRRMMDEALTRRPDLAAQRALLAAREAAVRVARASRWPSLYVNGSATRNYNELYGMSNRNMTEDDWSYNGGVSLRWNLFDGLQTLSSLRMAEAQAAALREQIRQAELAASAEIWTRFHAYETARRKHDFSAAALKSATASREMAFQSYQAGVKTILDLLNAEAQLSRARSQHVTARQEIFTALTQLAHAVGLLERGEAGLHPAVK